MYINHETDIPYIIADKRSDSLKIRLDIEDGNIEAVYILYGDSYDYEDRRDSGWNYTKAAMNRRYDTGRQQIWEAAVRTPEWNRVKYSFLLCGSDGREYLFNEYGCLDADDYAMEKLEHSYHSHFFYPYVYEEDAIQYPEWAEETVWYEIFTDRFARGSSAVLSSWRDWADERPDRNCFYGGDLEGVIQKLDYLSGLGINGIYLTPVFKAETNHKYDTIDYFQVDPHFGSRELLKELVERAHAKGIRVILDGVFNHISWNHPFWLDVLEKQEASEYKDFFCIRDFPVGSSQDYSKKLNYETFSFVASMPKLNYENPKVKEYIISVITYWIRECNIDGWRFDVGNELSFSFYNELKRVLKPLRDDLYLVAEIWHDSNRWFRNGYLDATMNYSLGTVILDYAVHHKIDADTFNQRYFQVQRRLSEVHSRMSFNLLDSHDTIRILTRAEGNRQKVKNAFLMLFLLPGSPCIYYGTEVGLCGQNDPDNRRPMIWDEERTDQELLQYFQRLIALRRENIRWLQHASVGFTELEECRIWTFYDEAHQFRLFHNHTGESRQIPGGSGLISTSGSEGLLEPDSMILVSNK